jgi:hypothetical protein
LFLAVINFLHVNSKNHFVIVCFSKIVAAITISRKHMRMGKKSCLFVYYVKLIGTKLWMVEKGATLNGGLKTRTVQGRIRRKI